MIRRLVDFALQNRFLVLAWRFCCSHGGSSRSIAFRSKPIQTSPTIMWT